MPRCLMHCVRGYKTKKFWDCETNHQNVMMTRSGLLIQTRPRQFSHSMTSLPGPSNPKSSPKSTEIRTKPKVPSREKSMSNLSVITRIGMERDGVNIDLGIKYVSRQRMKRTKKDKRPALQPAKQRKKKQNKSEERCPKLLELKTTGKSKEKPKVLKNESPTVSSSSGFYSESNGYVFGFKNNNNSNSNKTFILNPRIIQAQGSGMGFILRHAGPSISDSFNLQPRSTLAERHPVLLRCISKEEIKIAANSFASLTSNPKIMIISPKKCVQKSPQKLPTPSTAPHESMPSPCVLPDLEPKKEREVDNESVASEASSLSQSTTDEDDRSSLTSYSSSDEAYVQEASEKDETFLQDLTCFQLECHAHATDTNGNKIHKCTVCQRVFTVFSAFKSHVNTHVKPKNRCTACGKIFSRSWLLKGHVRTHTGEKPYVCKFSGCHKKFADKSNLRSHALIHTTKEKAYVCEKCKRAFAQKRYLHKHELEVCKIQS